MANIQTDISKLDNRKFAENKGFLLPYQLDWVYDDSRFKICEKSIRIGMTFAQEFAAVRGRLESKTDYLHSSVTQGVALQFIRECGFWIEQYKIKGTHIGETDYVDELNDINARALYIEFPNKSRIVSFSSSPNAMRGFGGAVGLDEIAFHRKMADMIKGAGGRALWGDPVAMWSSHNGVDSDFNQFIQKQQADPKSKWSLHKVTVMDAIAQGLVETINRVKKTDFTNESFLDDCKAAVGSIDAFEEECMCNPRELGLPAVSWYDLQASYQDYELISHTIEGNAKERDKVDPNVKELIAENPFSRLDLKKRYALGWDIALTGHLASINIIETDGKNHRHVLMINLHKCKLASQRELVRLAFNTLRGLTGNGDKGGLGRESCDILQAELYGRFTGVDFSTFKPYMGSKLTAVFEDQRMALSKSVEEVAYDIHGISTKKAGTRISYTERKNPVNQFSHCDMAWSIALAITAAEDDASSGPVVIAPLKPREEFDYTTTSRRSRYDF